MDYYSILRVSDDATKEILRNAYRIRARECHPDFGGNPEEMRLLNEAYQVLINPETRKAYDRARGFNTGSVQRSSSISPPDITPEKSRFFKDIQWLMTRAVVCFLLGFTCFGYSEEPRNMRMVEFAWVLRILSVAFFILGVQLSYLAHKTNRVQMSRKGSAYEGVGLKPYRLLFLTVIIVFVAVVITGSYLKR